ncbi:MAG TPA: hypothetical protein VEC38_08260 [Candidatus Binataceae bacterium]|nr:hypothetical protein [Candidatus Binataceae bacterium]
MRRAIARWLVVPILLTVALASGCQSETTKHLYKAEDLFEKRDLKGAQQELQLSIQADPNNADAHKSLAHVDEYLGDQEGAAREFEAASALDPTDQKLLQKARYYKTIQDLIKEADKAVDQIKAGQVAEGMGQLRDILKAARVKYLQTKVMKDLTDVLPVIAQQGDQQLKDKKFADAFKTYEQGVAGYILLAQAQNKQTLDPAADALIFSLSSAAASGATPDALSHVLDEVLTIDEQNKAANMELAQVYLHHNPPDYDTAADLEERAGAPDADVKKLRDQAKRHHKG